MTSSGRYQSKVFSFLSQQSLRVRDKTQQTWRQAKVAAVWGVQILLYPLYAGFQGTRLVGKQLRQTVRQTLPRLQAAKQALTTTEPEIAVLTVDTPIQQTLQAARQLVQQSPLLLTDSSTTSGETDLVTEQAGAIAPQTSSLATLPVIQGITSLLDNHKLALVTIENQLLDILTPEQQMQLERRMIWELASYWRQQRSLATSSPASLLVDNFLPLPPDRPNALLPIRIFCGLMSWIQASPIAIATNLFQEQQLAMLYASERSQATAYLPDAKGLRSAELSWLSFSEAFADLFADSSDVAQPLATRLANRVQAGATGIVRFSAQIAEHLLKKSGLILYVPPQTPELPAAPANPQPWLTLEDLFQPKPAAKTTQTWEPVHSPSHLVQQQPAQINRSSAGYRQRRSITPLADPAPSPTTIATYEAASVPATTESESTDHALSNTWIEAEVRLVTYVKHPLEQVLEWLDHSMLWIEARVAKAWNWLRDRLSSGKQSDD
ncbi:MAG: hypothetical protein Kow00121_35990 [Elainellaceae cyanobacterium]